MQQADIKKLKALLVEYRAAIELEENSANEPTLNSINNLINYINHDLKVNQP